MFLLLFLSFDINALAFFKMPYYKTGSLIIFIFFLFYLFLFYREERKYNFVSKETEEINCDYGVKVLFLNAFALFLSMYFLYLGSKLLVDSSVYIANNIFNVSEKVIGIILVAFGTSIPEIVVSLFSVVKKKQRLLLEILLVVIYLILD